MSSTPLVDSSIATGQNAEAELRSRQLAIENNRRSLNSGNPKDKETKLRESCEGFEAMFIQKMWEGMRATLPKDSIMQSRDEKHWQGMYDQELGKSMAKSGGIGLADMMVSQLSRNLQSASEVAAGSTTRKPMNIAPVPLLPENSRVLAEQKPATANQVAMAPVLAPAAGTASGTGTANGSPAGTAMTDIYAGPAETPEAPATPDAVAAALSVQSAQTATQKPASSPEVQAALANLATQAGEAHAVGARAAQQHTVMTEAAFNNLPTGAVASLGSMGARSAVVPGIPLTATKTSLLDEAPPSTLRARVSPRASPIGDQPARGRARRAGNMSTTQEQDALLLDSQNGAQRATPQHPYGASFASTQVYPPAGQKVPPSSLADAAADLIKSQVQPSVKTKL